MLIMTTTTARKTTDRKTTTAARTFVTASAETEPSAAYRAALELHNREHGYDTAHLFNLLAHDPIMGWAFYRIVELVLWAQGQGLAISPRSDGQGAAGAAELYALVEERLTALRADYDRLGDGVDVLGRKARHDAWAEAGQFGEFLSCGNVLHLLTGRDHPASFEAYCDR
jgi:hypothetical protein